MNERLQIAAQLGIAAGMNPTTIENADDLIDYAHDIYPVGTDLAWITDICEYIIAHRNEYNA